MKGRISNESEVSLEKPFQLPLLKTNLCTFSCLITMCSLVYMCKSSGHLRCDSNVHRNAFHSGIRQYLRTRQKNSNIYRTVQCLKSDLSRTLCRRKVTYCKLLPHGEGCITNLYTASCRTSAHILSYKNTESFRQRLCRYDDNRRERLFPYFLRWFWGHTHRYLREISSASFSYVDIPS